MHSLDLGLSRWADTSWTADAEDVPDGLAWVLLHRERHACGRLDHVEGLLALEEGLAALHLRDGLLRLKLAAADARHLGRLEAALRLLLPPRPPAPPTSVAFGFWSSTRNGGQRREQELDVPQWDAIRENYPGGVATTLDELHQCSSPPAEGRLLVLHGPPGTGKTHLVRTLAAAWRDWATFDVVVDPDVLLSKTDYLLDVLTETRDEEQWTVLVLEDTGEVLHADALRREGQGLSRFLNVLDGLLGQGTRTLALLTTNEDLEALHPAVVRPGRCAAAIRIDAFEAREADAWRVARGLEPTGREATLAELYAERHGSTVPVGASKRAPIGFR